MRSRENLGLVICNLQRLPLSQPWTYIRTNQYICRLLSAQLFVRHLSCLVLLFQVIRFLSAPYVLYPPHAFQFGLHWVSLCHIVVAGQVFFIYLHGWRVPKPHIRKSRWLFGGQQKPTMKSSLFLALGLALRINAHGIVTQVMLGDIRWSLLYFPLTLPCLLCNSYPGFDTRDWQQSTKPTVGWNIKDVTDLGFVSPDQYGGPDIICHRNASPVTESVKVEAGGDIELQWTEWPESHHGPVINYLANCRGSCSEVDKTSLKFNKIDQAGLSSKSPIPWTVGRYASDKLIADGNKWIFTVPSYIAPGNYVLRHEIIALHSAYDPNGAQNYPQCINLVVTGKGTDDLSSGTPGESLYTADEPGILINIYQDINYIIPGPPLYKPSQAESPSKSSKELTAEQKSIFSSPSALSLRTSTSEALIAVSTPVSSVIPMTIYAGKLPIVSSSLYVASGNFSAPLASHYRSISIAHPTDFTSLSPAPTSISPSIRQTLHPTVILNTVTSIQTATILPTPKMGFTTTPTSKQESSPHSTSQQESRESTPNCTPQGSNGSSTEKTGTSTYAEDNQASAPTSKGSTGEPDDTNTPSVPEHNSPSKAPHNSTISDLLDLLEKTLERLRKKLGKSRKHPRDIVHHWKSHWLI